jgi:predicted NBD/HSP70 family sugar kinase
MYVSASAVKRRAEELGFKKKRVKASDRGKTGCLRVSGDDTTVENRKERSAKIDIERQAQDERGSSHRRDRDSEEESEAEEVPFTSKDVFEAALSSGRNDPPSDSQALQVVEEVADYLGLGCLNLCRIVDPGLILFAGGMSGAGPLFLDMVKARFNFYGWRILPNDVDFKVAALGGDSVGAWGAARAATLSVRGKKDENISKEKK